jgi:hypothetical protein
MNKAIRGNRLMTKKPENPVGYRKPPVSGQFKPGQSGNPKGRPKGRKSPDQVIADLFSRKVTILEGGKKKKISHMEALGRRVLNDGLKGNAKATDQALTLLKIMSSLQSDPAEQDDGTMPDASADLRAVQALLRHHDVSMDNEDDEDD